MAARSREFQEHQPEAKDLERDPGMEKGLQPLLNPTDKVNHLNSPQDLHKVVSSVTSSWQAKLSTPGIGSMLTKWL